MHVVGTRLIEASKLSRGMWIAASNPRFNQRVVDTGVTRDGQIRVHADYGNGGEPATLFFATTDRLRVI